MYIYLIENAVIAVTLSPFHSQSPCTSHLKHRSFEAKARRLCWGNKAISIAFCFLYLPKHSFAVWQFGSV